MHCSSVCLPIGCSGRECYTESYFATTAHFADLSAILLSHCAFFFFCCLLRVQCLYQTVPFSCGATSEYGCTKCLENKGSTGVPTPTSIQQQVLNEFYLCGRLLCVSMFCVCCSINIWVQGVVGLSKQLGGAGPFLVRYGGVFGKKWGVGGGGGW